MPRIEVDLKSAIAKAVEDWINDETEAACGIQICPSSLVIQDDDFENLTITFDVNPLITNIKINKE